MSASWIMHAHHIISACRKRHVVKWSSCQLEKAYAAVIEKSSANSISPAVPAALAALAPDTSH